MSTALVHPAALLPLPAAASRETALLDDADAQQMQQWLAAAALLGTQTNEEHSHHAMAAQPAAMTTQPAEDYNLGPCLLDDNDMLMLSALLGGAGIDATALGGLLGGSPYCAEEDASAAAFAYARRLCEQQEEEVQAKGKEGSKKGAFHAHGTTGKCWEGPSALFETTVTASAGGLPPAAPPPLAAPTINGAPPPMPSLAILTTAPAGQYSIDDDAVTPTAADVAAGAFFQEPQLLSDLPVLKDAAVQPNVLSAPDGGEAKASENVGAGDSVPHDSAVAPTHASERKTLTLEHFSAVFHLTVPEAAAALGIGSTQLKKRCRQLGIARWPGRRLNSIRAMAEFAMAEAQSKAEELAAAQAAAARMEVDNALASPGLDTLAGTAALASFAGDHMQHLSQLMAASEVRTCAIRWPLQTGGVAFK